MVLFELNDESFVYSGKSFMITTDEKVLFSLDDICDVYMDENIQQISLYKRVALQLYSNSLNRDVYRYRYKLFVTIDLFDELYSKTIDISVKTIGICIYPIGYNIYDYKVCRHLKIVYHNEIDSSIDFENFKCDHKCHDFIRQPTVYLSELSCRHIFLSKYKQNCGDISHIKVTFESKCIQIPSAIRDKILTKDIDYLCKIDVKKSLFSLFLDTELSNLFIQLNESIQSIDKTCLNNEKLIIENKTNRLYEQDKINGVLLYVYKQTIDIKYEIDKLKQWFIIRLILFVFSYIKSIFWVN